MQAPRQNNLLEDQAEGAQAHQASQRKAQSTDFQGVTQSRERFGVYGH